MQNLEKCLQDQLNERTSAEPCNIHKSHVLQTQRLYRKCMFHVAKHQLDPAFDIPELRWGNRSLAGWSRSRRAAESGRWPRRQWVLGDRRTARPVWSASGPPTPAADGEIEGTVLLGNLPRSDCWLPWPARERPAGENVLLPREVGVEGAGRCRRCAAATVAVVCLPQGRGGGKGRRGAAPLAATAPDACRRRRRACQLLPPPLLLAEAPVHRLTHPIREAKRGMLVR